MRGPGPGPGGPPVANPRVERRLRDLEEKLDRLLKELDGLKGEKKEKPKGTTTRAKSDSRPESDAFSRYAGRRWPQAG